MREEDIRAKHAGAVFKHDIAFFRIFYAPDLSGAFVLSARKAHSHDLTAEGKRCFRVADTQKGTIMNKKIALKTNGSIRKLTVTAIMSAVAYVLMILEFNVPFTPTFLKFDFSDLPAFVTAFALGPVWGVAVELVKNVLHLLFTHTAGVGELANFIIGSCIVFPAGLVYKLRKNRSSAVIGALVGAVFAAVASFPVNYFITYPFYAGFMGMDNIIAAYNAIIPAIDSLPKALLIINLPFTLFKGIINAVITFVIYKKLSPIIKPKRQ